MNPIEIPVGNPNGDLEIGNIHNLVEVLLHSAKKHSNITSPSIHMIPGRIRGLKPRVFNPRQVSIGPLHRKDKSVEAFEEQKVIFLHDILGLPQEKTLETCVQKEKASKERIKAEQTLEKCVQKVKASIERIKACYGNGIKGYNDDDITKMMVMDACFILEFLYKKSNDLFDEMVIEPMSMSFDLLLIENQIPFFVLQDIFDCTSSRFQPETSLPLFIICGFAQTHGLPKSKFKIMNNKVCDEPDHYSHILGLIHEYYRPLDVDQTSLDVDKLSDSKTYFSADESPYLDEDVEINNVIPGLQTFYSAVELDRAGMNFKPHHQPQEQQWPMDIKLDLPRFSWCRPWAMPTLRMPVLRINNYTELVFRNLIAYEQLCPNKIPRHITSYALAMDLLVDNHEDVAILVKSKVLFNTIGSNKEAAKLINDMRKEIYCPRFFYKDVWKDMNDYHNKVLPRNIARLKRTYFSNPWRIIALVAGIFLFLFTMVQTYFTVNPV